jgi:hypothetical protein
MPLLIILQARAISAWKLSPRSGAAAAKLPRLDDSERRMLAVARSRRLAEVASKQCLQVIKALMAHKVRALQAQMCAKHELGQDSRLVTVNNCSSSTVTRRETCRNWEACILLLKLSHASCVLPGCYSSDVAACAAAVCIPLQLPR